jgi:hypothetical protein
MNNFGSNNLVPYVHVLYLNVGTKWTKNQAWGPNLTRLPTPKYGKWTNQLHHHGEQCFWKPPVEEGLIWLHMEVG